MRRFLAALLIVVLVPLAARAATPSGAPILVVYPFTPNGGTINKEAPTRLATLIAEQVAQGGKVAVKAPPPVVERKDFLTTARALEADYYLSGFITPLGDGVTVVQQLVSTASGIVVYSDTASLNSYADAQGIGDQLRAAILTHAQRNLPVAAPPSPAQAATPQAVASGRAEANLGGLFKGRRKSAPAAKATAAPTDVPAAALKIAPSPLAVATAPPRPRPAATPVATAAPAAPAAAAPAAAAPVAATLGSGSAAVAAVGGAADAASRETAAARLISDVGAVHRTAARADACTQGVTEVMRGTLSTSTDPTFGGHNATFELVIDDCAGHVVYRRSGTASAGGANSLQLAVERAVDAAAGAYLHPNKRR